MLGNNYSPYHAQFGGRIKTVRRWRRRGKVAAAAAVCVCVCGMCGARVCVQEYMYTYRLSLWIDIFLKLSTVQTKSLITKDYKHCVDVAKDSSRCLTLSPSNSLDSNSLCVRGDINYMPFWLSPSAKKIISTPTSKCKSSKLKLLDAPHFRSWIFCGGKRFNEFNWLLSGVRNIQLLTPWRRAFRTALASVLHVEWNSVTPGCCWCSLRLLEYVVHKILPM